MIGAKMTDIFNWREHLPIHPAAELFPLMSEAELKELAADIKENGLQAPILLTDETDDRGYITGRMLLLDGRNRLDALALLGWLRPQRERNKGELAESYKDFLRFDPLVIFGNIDPNDDPHVYEDLFDNPDGDPYALAISLNIHRRHLTSEQKRDLIAALLKANPEQSNLAIAKQVKADDKTVAKVRTDLESRSEIPNVETRTDSKGREQPARKPKPPGAPDAPDLSEVATDDSAEARKQHYAETETPIAEDPQFEIRMERKELLANLLVRVEKLEARNNVLAAALNAKEAEAGRDWPADMTPGQVNRRNNCLKQIAAWQRNLEQLYGEATGRSSWRVEVVTKDGERFGVGARFGTRGEAEFYDTNYARRYFGDSYAIGEIIPHETEKANVEVVGDQIGFRHGDCYLLNWHPIDAPAGVRC
jgi:hypothetical protein